MIAHILTLYQRWKCRYVENNFDFWSQEQIILRVSDMLTWWNRECSPLFSWLSLSLATCHSLDLFSLTSSKMFENLPFKFILLRGKSLRQMEISGNAKVLRGMFCWETRDAMKRLLLLSEQVLAAKIHFPNFTHHRGSIQGREKKLVVAGENP